MKRDTKGLYVKALGGEIKDFTCENDPYEEPENPELILDTVNESVDECCEKVIKKLQDLRYL
jgi:adenylylsulfate kinase